MTYWEAEELPWNTSGAFTRPLQTVWTGLAGAPECVFFSLSWLFKFRSWEVICCVYLATAWQTYSCRIQKEGQRGLGSNHLRSRSARSPRGRWSCARDNESTEGPGRRICRNHDRTLQKEENRRMSQSNDRRAKTKQDWAKTNFIWMDCVWSVWENMANLLHQYLLVFVLWNPVYFMLICNFCGGSSNNSCLSAFK